MTNEELILERLARIEARLEGVARVEKQMAAFAGPWENLSDLGRDLSLLNGPCRQEADGGDGGSGNRVSDGGLL